MSKLRAALEEALREDPDDVAAHMAWADHAAESGDPRGEFAQVQLALENPKLRPAKRKELKEREAELLEEHQDEWLGAVAEYAMYNRTWRRGWLAEVRLGLLDVFAASAIRELGPASLLRSLDVARNRQIEPGTPAHAALLTVGISEDRPSSALPLLRAAPFSRTLRTLRVNTASEIWDAPPWDTAIGLAHMLGTFARWSCLEELEAQGNLDDYPLLFRLEFPRLRSLILIDETDELIPMATLASHAGFPSLETLRIIPADNDHGVRLGELVAFLSSPCFPRLRTLSLENVEFGDEGCYALVRSGVLKRLKALELRRCEIGDEGAQALAWCGDTERLDRLDLSGNPIGRAGKRTLREYHIRVEFDGDDGEYDNDME